MHPEERPQANQAVLELDIHHLNQGQSPVDWNNQCSTSVLHTLGFHYLEDEST